MGPRCLAGRRCGGRGDPVPCPHHTAAWARPQLAPAVFVRLRRRLWEEQWGWAGQRHDYTRGAGRGGDRSRARQVGSGVGWWMCDVLVGLGRLDRSRCLRLSRGISFFFLNHQYFILYFFYFPQWFSLFSLSVPHYNHKISFSISFHHLLPFSLTLTRTHSKERRLAHRPLNLA